MIGHQFRYSNSITGGANEDHGCECVQNQILEYRECVGWKMHAKLKPRVGDGWIGSRLFGMVDGNARHTMPDSPSRIAENKGQF